MSTSRRGFPASARNPATLNSFTDDMNNTASALNTFDKSITVADELGMVSPVKRGEILSLPDCVTWLLEVAKVVQKELWLPFALRGVIYESVSKICQLADKERLSRARAIEIIGHLEECCLFYKNLAARSKTIQLVQELSTRIQARLDWSLPS